jgi:GTP-binding protein
MELGANDEQLDFTTVYAIGRDGVAMKGIDDERKDLSPLFETILEKVPVAANDTTKTFRMQAFNLAYDNFLGRLAVGRVYEGVAKMGDVVFVKTYGGTPRQAKITKLFTFHGFTREEVQEAQAGDIVMLAGIPDIFIGETISTDKDAELLPAITIDEPTIVLDFLVNNSPFAGKEGKFVTSRQIRERLEKELEVNVGLKVNFDANPDRIAEGFTVYGRGEMHIAVLLETMRREGFEMQISQPQVIIKDIGGVKSEPFEEVTIDAPAEHQGVIIEKLGMRGFIMSDMNLKNNTVRMVFKGPTRGLLGYRNQFMVDTKGEGIMSSRVLGFEKYAGEITRRNVGSMISMENGKALAFALWGLQDRGTLYIGAQTEVYEGMVIGNTSKGEEMKVNPTKGKQLTNMRASGTDEAVNVIPPWTMTIERGLEVMVDDEFLEITPLSVRLRKQYLNETDRAKARRPKNQ